MRRPNVTRRLAPLFASFQSFKHHFRIFTSTSIIDIPLPPMWGKLYFKNQNGIIDFLFNCKVLVIKEVDVTKGTILTWSLDSAGPTQVTWVNPSVGLDGTVRVLINSSFYFCLKYHNKFVTAEAG